MSHFCPIEAVEMEGFGGGGVITPAFGDVQVAGVLDGRGDGGADGGQVGRPAAGAAGRGIFAESDIPDVLQGRSPAS
jgi:hypothetical protein